MACTECLADSGHWPRCSKFPKPKPPPDPPKKPDPKR